MLQKHTEWQPMENEYKKLADKVDRIEASVEKIETALLGNEYSNKTGLIHSIAEHHQRLNSLERLVERGKWLIIGLSAGTGIGVYEILKQIFK
jgi:Mg2+ and Co2+ transporter CorA